MPFFLKKFLTLILNDFFELKALICNKFEKTKMLRHLKIAIFVLVISVIVSCNDDDPKPFKQTVNLIITHKWKDSALKLNKENYWDRSFRIDTISVNNIIYHINNLRLKTTDSLIVDAHSQYYMVDLLQNKTFPQDIAFETPLEGVKYYICSIEFTIGIEDSITNLKNTLSTLFPNPMYSDSIKGYINFNFEGYSNKINSIKYKVGGYVNPYKNSRRIKLTLNKPFLLNRYNTLSLKADIFKLFKSKNQIDIETLNYVEKPDNDSKKLAENIATIFSVESFK